MASFALFIYLPLLVLPADQATSYWVCVSNERAGRVSIIDPHEQRVVASVPVGKRPRGVHASPDGQILYVALSGSPIQGPLSTAPSMPIGSTDSTADGIGVVNLKTLTLIKMIHAGSDPEEFAISHDGSRLYVANEDAGTLSIVDVNSGHVVDTVRVRDEPEGVRLTPDERFVYVTCETEGQVCVIDTKSDKVVNEFVVLGRPRSSAFLLDGSRVFVPSETGGLVKAFDTSTFAEVDTIALPAGSRPMGTAISPDGRLLYATTGHGGTVAVIDVANARVQKTIPVGERPWGIGISPNGKVLYTANGRSNDVSVIDAESNTEVKRIKADEGPWGIAIVPASK